MVVQVKEATEIRFDHFVPYNILIQREQPYAERNSVCALFAFLSLFPFAFADRLRPHAAMVQILNFYQEWISGFPVVG